MSTSSTTTRLCVTSQKSRISTNNSVTNPIIYTNVEQEQLKEVSEIIDDCSNLSLAKRRIRKRLKQDPDELYGGNIDKSKYFRERKRLKIDIREYLKIDIRRYLK